MAFSGFIPDFWCKNGVNNITNDDNGTNLNSCSNNISMCDREFDMSKLTIVNEWDLVCENRWISFTITTVQMTGALIGAFGIGYAGDRFGRRISLYTILFLHGIFVAVSAFSNSWQLFAAMRFGIGMVGGAVSVVNFIAAVEFVGKGWRALLGAIPVWSGAAPCLALIAYLFPNWRHLEFFIFALNTLVLLGFFIVPESIRWLTVKGRIEEASAIACLIAERSKKPPPDTAVIQKIAEEEQSRNRYFSSYSFIDLVRGKRIRLITLRVWYTWFASALVYWSLVFGVQNMSGNFYLNFFLVSVIEIPASLIILLWIDRKNFGRRRSIVLANSLTAFSALGAAIATLTAPESSKAYYVNICVLIAKFCVTSGWSSMSPFTTELYPTVIRILGYGSAGTVAKVGGIFATQVVALAVKEGYLLYVIICVLMIIDTASILTLPETRGEALPDTLFEITKHRDTQDKCSVESGDEQNKTVLL
ncbi:hypothetical protein LOTGIDRAFT_161068 [Lottia gigantea]|uniref:Major facilitator superfamily (MFS) profile domain-containing protein n=1 Tax=Lottia gigantea TaxID=225164 RepID=V4AD87_LOTGI|nr:hypothetical protein LOTGIDRAFT_161068 [Lottia gigantea]ESO94817.1 hypothetical protein LOTGIDRAFT_161068 [Lottia gigantea]